MALRVLELLGILLRWAHIASAATLVGGAVWARTVVTPALEPLDPEERIDAWRSLAARYGPLLYAAVAGALVSGLYNFFSHRGHTSYYQIWFGIKMLLVAHIFATAILLARMDIKTAEDERKRRRRLAGMAASGLVVILISAFLRRIF